MANDILAPALIQSMAGNLSLLDLIRTADIMKGSGQGHSIGTLYATWIEHNQNNPLLYAALFNYSVILSDGGMLAKARECLEKALALNPDFMPAYINLGRILERQGSTGLAVAQWSAAVARLGAVNGTSVMHKTTALNQIARTLEASNQDDAAEEMLRQSLDLDPRQREVAQHLLALRQRQCKWPVMVPTERVGREDLMQGISPLSGAAFTDDPMLHLALAWHYNKVDVGQPADALFAWPKAIEATGATGGKLRIGYLSSDLREHAVGHLVSELFPLHDRDKVEIFAYYCGPDSSDTMHANFKATADHWLSINGMDDVSAARRMVEDGIQILVDLNGYTREARYKLVALRPAPVIVNWLGFPGTMASPYHHYVIADDWIIPEESELYYSEKVLRLPCYQPNNRQRIVSPRQITRAQVNLPENAMVYCSFNGAHKITRFTFERWMTILDQVPDSVLWLLSSSEETHQRLRQHAAERGIAAERLIFADKLINPEHLARYALADLFLDTTPYGAHTTASDALWMGVPVLTLSGRSFASRVCGSLVRSAGLPELVCTRESEYVERAVALGRDRSRLQAYRDRLLAGRDTCVLFDTPLLVRSLENLYCQMWEDFRNGRLPRPDLANLQDYLDVGIQVDHETVEVQTLSDYREWWQANLARRHRLREIAADKRFFSDPEQALARLAAR